MLVSGANASVISSPVTRQALYHISACQEKFAAVYHELVDLHYFCVSKARHASCRVDKVAILPSNRLLKQVAMHICMPASGSKATVNKSPKSSCLPDMNGHSFHGTSTKGSSPRSQDNAILDSPIYSWAFAEALQLQTLIHLQQSHLPR